MNTALRLVSRWISMVLVGAGCGSIASLSGNASGAFLLGVFLAVSGGFFVGATNLATWGQFLRNPPRGVSPAAASELYGSGVFRAVSIGLFGLDLAFGGSAASGSYLLPAGAAGLVALLIGREPSRHNG